MKTLNISSKDRKFIEAAMEAAEKSKMLMKHGCVVVNSNRIIGTGYNNYRNSFNDGFIENTCSCHAEMHALRNAIKVKSKGSSRQKHMNKSKFKSNPVGQRKVQHKV